MKLKEMLDYLPDEKVSKPLAKMGIMPVTAQRVISKDLNDRAKRNLFNKIDVSSFLEAEAKIAIAIAAHNGLPIEFEYSLNMGYVDELPTGSNRSVN